MENIDAPQVQGPAVEVYVREGFELAWPRLWARIIDVNLWGVLFGLLLAPVLLFFPDTPFLLLNVVALFVYAFFEAAMLLSFSATPGKWVMGITVTDAEGRPLTYASALKRSLDVYVRGMGFGFALLTVICMAASYDRLKRAGSMWWDLRVSSQVSGPRIGTGRKILAVLLIVAIIALSVASTLLERAA